jgi:hypothetical protein
MNSFVEKRKKPPDGFTSGGLFSVTNSKLKKISFSCGFHPLMGMR